MEKNKKVSLTSMFLGGFKIFYNKKNLILKQQMLSKLKYLSFSEFKYFVNKTENQIYSNTYIAIASSVGTEDVFILG